MLIQLEITFNRTLKLALAAIVLAALAIAAYFVTRPSFLPIEHIKIHAPYRQVSAKRVQAIAMPYVRAGFFGLPATKLRDALLTVPWLKSVSIKKQFPDTLVITLEEKTAIATWRNRGLFTAKGHLFYPDSKLDTQKLVQLSGPKGYADQVFAAYQKMSSIVSGLNLHVKRCELTSRMAWQLQLEDGMQLLLGRSRPYERLDRFARIYKRVFVAGKRATKVDLRYASGMAVTWQEKS